MSYRHENRTEEMGEAITEKLEIDEVEQPLYDEGRDQYISLEPDYEFLNQDTAVVYVEYSPASSSQGGSEEEKWTGLFALLEGEEVRGVDQMAEEEKGRILQYFKNGDFEEPVEPRLNSYHMERVEQEL